MPKGVLVQVQSSAPKRKTLERGSFSLVLTDLNQHTVAACVSKMQVGRFVERGCAQEFVPIAERSARIYAKPEPSLC